MGSNSLGAQLLQKILKHLQVQGAHGAGDYTASSVLWQPLTSLWLVGRKGQATRRKTHFCVIAQVKPAPLTQPDKSFPAYYFL